ncbi:MAG: hypothetical protein ACEY3M_06775, partial [Wolbachia sp.]
GVLLSSSNASTWTPHQNLDLTFRLLAAKFSEVSHVVDLGIIIIMKFGLGNFAALHIKRGHVRSGKKSCILLTIFRTLVTKTSSNIWDCCSCWEFWKPTVEIRFKSKRFLEET